MAIFLVSKRGVPVLAYLSSPDASQCCRLIVKHAELYKQATVSLQFSLPSNSKEIVTLLYDADNLVPDESSLTQETASLTSNQLEHLTREITPQLMRMCLSLRQLCPISCSARLLPKHNDQAFLHQLLELASAKKVHILFDFKWVHQQHHAAFQQIIRCQGNLTGLPADLSTLYQPKEWSAAFYPLKNAGSEAPPSSLAASKKPPIQARTSPTPDLPQKRAFLGCAPNSTPSLDVSHSPTKRSTAASTVLIATPEAPPLYDDIYSWHARTNPAFVPLSSSNDVLLSAALELPGSPTEKATTAATPSPEPSSSLVANALDLDEAMYRAVQKLLPQAVRENLPSPITKFHDETYEQVERLRSTAVEEFDKLLAEKELDFEIAKDDNITELDHVFAGKVAEFKDRAEEIADEVHDRAYSRFGQKLEWLIQEQTAILFERRALKLDRRAVSLPL
ncbi:hypothetical protein EK21DRAFT_89551 [Setomelanomma holmii]|uniref:Uncharacterized protein n=1 Tax=Setomelanomma holmii TaxID=210430 RepID=A0A9P4LM14_9PLEO|nr:hypothetical protein EK21DRAFT_89551 [Setomelanomma holmii]